MGGVLHPNNILMSMSRLLQTPLSYLTGVGPKRAEALARELSLHTFGDLLHHYPNRYVDRSRFYAIRELNSDMPYVQLRGYIRDFVVEGAGRKQRLVASFYDGTGMIELIWFKGLQTIQRMYQLGREYIIFGKPTSFNGAISLVHPEVDDADKAQTVAGGLVPIYSSSEKLKNMGVTNRQMRTYLRTLLPLVAGELHETLPPAIHQASRLMAYPEALMQIHFPTDVDSLEMARRRLKVEELLLIQLKMQSEQIVRKESYRGLVLGSIGTHFNTLYKEGLPFDLTGAQKRVLKEIRSDVLSGYQMNRLVQGDVGSGKTLVALFAMLMAVDSGYQACMMAPTEILARQHHANLSELLLPLGIEPALLIGSTTKRERNKMLPALAAGEIPIVVGTHALIEDTVQFAHLAMAVIDEQHRFGVEQRSKLWTKTDGVLPHILIMSATPIPRTLAMTLYGDLDISVIDELPPGRKPIETYHQHENEMHKVYSFLRSEIMKGRQVYVVFPMIEESEHQDLKDLESGLERYQRLFPEYRVAYVHGKMKPKDKDERMQDFVQGRAQILLATTVIEVGVNVPNASVMVIEGANRFGLSQLHQLRGRVGRGAEQSYCILTTNGQLGPDSRKRIEIMCETNDGFVIAEEDMRLRGFGELEGTRQSGKELSLRIANLAKDAAMVQYCRQLAENILYDDPKLTKPENLLLRQRLAEVYGLSQSWSSIS